MLRIVVPRLLHPAVAFWSALLLARFMPARALIFFYYIIPSRRCGLRKIALSREGIIPLLEHNDGDRAVYDYGSLLKHAKKRFIMITITLQTALDYFSTVDGRKILKKKIGEMSDGEGFIFRLHAANPHDSQAFTHIESQGIEEPGASERAKAALDFFHDQSHRHKENPGEHVKASKHPPHAFILICDDHLYLQPYLPNKTSTIGIAFKFRSCKAIGLNFEKIIHYHKYQINARAWKPENGNDDDPSIIIGTS